jgi:DNA-binding transcriptional MerR regulator
VVNKALTNLKIEQGLGVGPRNIIEFAPDSAEKGATECPSLPPLRGHPHFCITYVKVSGACRAAYVCIVETTTGSHTPDRFQSRRTRFDPSRRIGDSKEMTMKLMTAALGAANTNDVKSEAAGDFMRIGEMAKIFDVTLRTLRFYEDKGLLNPKREGSTRLYTRRDRARLKLILLGRKIGFSLRDVKQMIDLYDPSGSNAKQLRLTLDKSEKQMVRLQKQRQSLDEAMTELDGMISAVRKRLGERPVNHSAAAN